MLEMVEVAAIILSIVIGVISIPVAFFLGVVYSYGLRKFTARIQSRRGPFFLVPPPLRPLLGISRVWQPFYDVAKLCYKETVIPEGARKALFKAAPYFAVICSIIAILFLPIAGFSALGEFDPSIIIVILVIIGVPLLVTVGGSASSSPWGVIGARREVEMMLAYEVPIVLSALAASITANYAHSFNGIIDFQKNHLPLLLLNPFAAVAMFLGLMGKLNLKPFDIADAEVEVVAGPYTEYSGKLLGILEIAKIFLIFIVSTLFINLFLGGGIIGDLTTPVSIVLSIIIYLVEAVFLVLVLSILHAANPRYRIDQGFKWYLRIPLILSIIAIIFAFATRIVIAI
jgi:NADH-quinone oxidoreductase subunit H